MPTDTIDLTPDDAGYAAIGATLLAQVLSDVKRARQVDDHFILTTIIDIAFAFGAAAGVAGDIESGTKLRDALFARVGGPRR